MTHVEYDSLDDELRFRAVSKKRKTTEVFLPLFALSIFVTASGNFAGFKIGDAKRLVQTVYREQPFGAVTGVKLLSKLERDIIESCDDGDREQCKEVLEHLKAILRCQSTEIPPDILAPLLSSIAN